MLIIIIVLLIWVIVAELRSYKNMKIANANKTSAEAWLATTLLHIKAEKAANTYLKIIGDTDDSQQTQVFYLVRQLAKNNGYSSNDMSISGAFGYLSDNYADRLKISQTAVLEAKKQSKQ